MKNLFTLITLVFGINSYSQQTIKSESDNIELKSDVMEIDTEKGIVEYLGNVSFKTQIIQLENAEKIVYNKKTNEILVTGFGKFTIDGDIRFSNKAKTTTLRYKIGDKTAYLE